MNQQVIFEAVSRIEANPLMYNQACFGEYIPSCQTPCCIAGWICFIHDGVIPVGLMDSDRDGSLSNVIGSRAQEIAELTLDEAIELFSPEFGYTARDGYLDADRIRDEVTRFIRRHSEEEKAA